MALRDETLAFIGCGMMGEAMVKGLLRDRTRSLFPTLVVTAGVMLTVVLYSYIKDGPAFGISLFGNRCRLCSAGFRDDVGQHFVKPCFVFCRELRGRMIGVGEFHRGVDEGAASEAGALEPILERRKERFKPSHALFHVALHPLLEHSAELLFPVLQGGQNQVVLRGKMVVQRHLRHARFGNHKTRMSVADFTVVEAPHESPGTPGAR